MKNTRRHELQHNDLADVITQWTERIEPYHRAIVLGVVALVVGAGAWVYMSSQSKRQIEDGWDAYYKSLYDNPLSDPRTDLANVTKEYKDTPAGKWADIVLADIQLFEGTDKLFVDKASGQESLKEAATRFAAMIKTSRDPVILERATFGLAQANEAQGKLEDARKHYQEVTDKYPNGPYASTAKARANDLGQQSTKAFYDWLAQYERPRPTDGFPGIPGVRPSDSFLDSLPGSSVTLPNTINDNIVLPPVEGGAANPTNIEMPNFRDGAKGDAEKSDGEKSDATKTGPDMPSDDGPKSGAPDPAKSDPVTPAEPTE